MFVWKLRCSLGGSDVSCCYGYYGYYYPIKTKIAPDTTISLDDSNLGNKLSDELRNFQMNVGTLSLDSTGAISQRKARAFLRKIIVRMRDEDNCDFARKKFAFPVSRSTFYALRKRMK